MTRINIEADAAQEAGSYEPIPEGEYVLEVTDVKDKVTSTQRDMVNLELTVAEGPYQGRKLWTNVIFIPKGDAGHGFMVQALKAFGMEYDGSLSFDTQDFLGRTCRAKVAIGSYEKDGQTRMKNEIPTAGFITDRGEESAAPAKPAAQPPFQPTRQPVTPGKVRKPPF